MTRHAGQVLSRDILLVGSGATTTSATRGWWTSRCSGFAPRWRPTRRARAPGHGPRRRVQGGPLTPMPAARRPSPPHADPRRAGGRHRRLLGVGSYVFVDRTLHQQFLDVAADQARFDLTVTVPDAGLPHAPTRTTSRTACCSRPSSSAASRPSSTSGTRARPSRTASSVKPQDGRRRTAARADGRVAAGHLA